MGVWEGRRIIRCKTPTKKVTRVDWPATSLPCVSETEPRGEALKNKRPKIRLPWEKESKKTQSILNVSTPGQKSSLRKTTQSRPLTRPLRPLLKGTVIDFWEENHNQWGRTLGAGGGPSFVPRRVLLPFSLEEAAAPAGRHRGEAAC